jgi:hypothetical protein
MGGMGDERLPLYYLPNLSAMDGCGKNQDAAPYELINGV